jgi:hypothetical protein
MLTARDRALGVARGAHWFNVKLVLCPIAEVVVVLVASLAWAPDMTAVRARQGIRVRTESLFHEVVHAASGLPAVTVAGDDNPAPSLPLLSDIARPLPFSPRSRADRGPPVLSARVLSEVVNRMPRPAPDAPLLIRDEMLNVIGRLHPNPSRSRDESTACTTHHASPQHFMTPPSSPPGRNARDRTPPRRSRGARTPETPPRDSRRR